MPIGFTPNGLALGVYPEGFTVNGMDPDTLQGKGRIIGWSSQPAQPRIVREDASLT